MSQSTLDVIRVFAILLHVFVSLVLVAVVLLQQGKGGGMGAAFGGATTQVFGGRGAGNLLTRTTAVCAAIFMTTSVSLAHLSTSKDRAIEARAAQQAERIKDKGELKERSTDRTPAPTSETETAPTEETAPAETPTDAAATEPTPAPTTEPAPAPATETAPAAPAEEDTTAPTP